MALTVENLPAMPETRVQPLGQEDPLEKETVSSPVLLPGEFHGQRSLVGYSLWRLKRVRRDLATNIYLYSKEEGSKVWRY